MYDKSMIDGELNLQEFQSLWNDPKYLIGIYKFTHGYELLIDKANDTFINLFHLNNHDLKKPVNAFLPDETIQNLTTSVEIFNSKPLGTKATKREFEEIYGQTYWSISHQLSHNKIICIGKKIYDLTILPKKDPIDLSEPSIMVTLTDDNRYKIDSFSDYFLEKAVHSWMYSGYLDEYPFTINNIKTTRVVDECVRLNQTIQFIDVIKYHREQYFVLVTLIPIIHINNTKVLILIRKVNGLMDYDRNDKLINFKNDLLQYFNSKLVAICFLTLSSNKTFEIALSNECFDGLIMKDNLMQDNIVKSAVFKKCILTKNSVRGYIYSKDPKEVSAKYFVQMVPLITETIVQGILLTLDPAYEVTNNGKELILKLTKREREILSFVAEGYTNKFISSKLNISEGTVKRIISNGYKKLGISSRVELAKLYLTEE